MRRFILAGMVLGMLAPAVTVGAPGTDETTASWNVPPDARRHIKRKTKSVRIEYFVSTCGRGKASDYLRSVDVRRRRKAIDVTVVVAQPDPGTDPCPALAAVGHTRVDLQGRLGRRALRDASSDPPRVVVKRHRG